jgi:hypothetical protein
VQLSYRGLHNIIVSCYTSESWLGSASDEYPGAINKLKWVYDGSQMCRVIAFQAKCHKEVIEKKAKIRERLGLEKNSIHVTDSHKEAIELSQLLFNKNGLHFINFARPYRFSSFTNKLAQMENWIHNNRLHKSDVLIDGKMILAAYGLHEAATIDVIIPAEPSPSDCSIISPLSDNDVAHHGVQRSELIYNPNLYFEYMGFKFVAFEQLLSFKKKRGVVGDIHDLRLMAPLAEDQQRRFIDAARLRRILLSSSKNAARRITRTLGIYGIAKILHNMLLRRLD